eukprot:Trichotokara_eunicae@DN276_c0_g1_i1.p1
MAEFADLGSHCTVETCNEKDFLPIVCKYCELKFCRDHAMPNLHECKSVDKFDKRVIICPICNKSIHITAADDENRELEKHQKNEICRRLSSSNFTKKKKKKKKKKKVLCVD